MSTRPGQQQLSTFERARGYELYDVDRNEYIDYALGEGPVTPRRQILRFILSGSEAVQQVAIRPFMRRNRIVKFEGHCHGWFNDVFVSAHHARRSRLNIIRHPLVEIL